METDKFRELLEAARNRKNAASIDAVSAQLTERNVKDVDLSSLGINMSKVEDRLEKEKAVEVLQNIYEPAQESSGHKVLGVARDDITLNEKQQEFLETVVRGEDVILIGAAGTGKTTSMRQTTAALLEMEDRLPKLKVSTKYLQMGRPGGVILSYTRKAVNNIRHAVVEGLKSHTLTIHKLLEFEPVFYEVPDPNNVGSFKTTMKFEPMRNQGNPLPSSLIFVAFEESSMIGTDLYRMFEEAMPHPHQEVFLGDIQQLPPVFGLAILGFKMVELPIVELTEVYRQAANSPIISLAHLLLKGDPTPFHPKIEAYTKPNGKVIQTAPSLKALEADNEFGTLKIDTWPKKFSDFHANQNFAWLLELWIKQGFYKPFEDIILMPFNKAFGTIEVNKVIANIMGKQRKATVHQVVAGFEKHYLAIGDRVLYDKEDAIITNIRRNGEFLGDVAPASEHLDRWGILDTDKITKQERLQAAAEDEEFSLTAMDNYLSNTTSAEDRVNQASHVVTIELTYQDGSESNEIVLQTAGEVNNLLGGHALTVHKFQGSENERVFFIMQNTNAIMNQREMLYTAVTRAKKWLYILCETDTFYKGIQSQAVKGNTLAEKATFFMGKKDALEKLKKEEVEALKKHNSLGITFEAKKPATTIIGGQKAIRLQDLPSPAMKLEAEESLKFYWNEAIRQFGAEIGKIPTLHFNIRSNKTVGRATFATGMIHINPVWLAVGERDEEVRATIVHDTMIHEICHHVAARKYRDFGHDVYWRNCMKKMGRPVINKDNAVGLPSWYSSKQYLLKEILLGAEEQATEEPEEELVTKSEGF